MATSEKVVPVLIASFSTEEQVWPVVSALEERHIGRDFIGVLISDDGFGPGGPIALHMVSVLAPRRLHEEIRSALTQAGATAIGGLREMSDRYGLVPHPGVIEAHDLKLTTGSEYWQLVARRRPAGQEAIRQEPPAAAPLVARDEA